MKRVAIVIQRWAPDVVGGSEALAWQYAELLSGDFEVELLTSTAIDYVSWESVLPEGEERIGEVLVRRFAPAFRRGDYFYWLDRCVRDTWSAAAPAAAGAVPKAWTTALQEELIKFQGPWCPGLVAHLLAHEHDYDAILLGTYLYPTSYFPARALDRAKLILIPTLHDEPIAYLPVFRRYRDRIAKFLWLTGAEREIARRLWKVDGDDVIGMAIDAEPAAPEARVNPYILYCGRIDVHKNCNELLDAFASYRAARPGSRLELVMTGKDVIGVGERPGVHYAGFVEDARKRALMAGAVAFVQPSRFESFSIVTLEAMAQGTPVLVNAECAVLEEHARQSGGGIAWRGREAFASALDTLLAQSSVERETMAVAARSYAIERYGREHVRARLVAAVTAAVDSR